MSDTLEQLPPKPLRRVDVKFHGKWISSCISDCVPKGWADGFVARHLMDYPCDAIRVVRYDGQIEFEHPGNGEVHLNLSKDAPR